MINDFTKEELIWLGEEIILSNEQYLQPDIAYIVNDKIKSLIDKYCEHEVCYTDYDYNHEICRAFKEIVE